MEDGVSAIVRKNAVGFKTLIRIVPLSMLSRMLTVSNAFLEEYRGG